MESKTSSYLLVVVLTYIAAHNVFAMAINEDWRLDNRYEQWTMKGTFIQGTPRQCPKPLAPRGGRWICSYGFGEQGRSLCMVDCQRGFVIERKPVIYNCEFGVWRLFPREDEFVQVPNGNCISIQEFLG